jgi:polyisoprenoid-binding protein YceI
MSATSWKFDEHHSAIRFSVRHLVVAKVGGQFKRWSAEMTADEADLTSASVNVTIDATSVDTGDPKRDGHLLSRDFLNAEQFPTLTFRSRRIEPVGKDTYRAVGDLTIRDVTKETTLDVELGGYIRDPWGFRRAGFSVKGSILRSDFGMLWNQVLDVGGVAVSDRVDIAIEIAAVTKAEQAVA